MAPWPLPRTFQHEDHVLWLSQNVQLIHDKVRLQEGDSTWYEDLESAGAPSTSHQLNYPNDLLETAFERFKTKLVFERFVPYKFYPRRALFEPSIDHEKTFVEEINIEECMGQVVDQSAISREAYSIAIDRGGSVRISIIAPEGGIRAFDTLAQLFFAHSKDDHMYTPYAPLAIKDAPRFEHRGLNLDISRNWIPPQDVIRTIEAMGFNKLNRLHLHASDAQSWPLEIPSLPDLAKAGAYREDQIWTKKDLEDVQRHGMYHGVEVYLEIDLPGHTASIFHSHPHLITAYNKAWSTYAMEPPAGQLKLNCPEVPPFLTTLLNDLLPRSLPFSSHFHIGGDELNKEAYNLDPTVHSSSKEVIRPLLQNFIDHVLSLVESDSLTPVVWEEMLLEWELKFPASTIVQTWRSGSSLAKVVAKGYRALFGPCEEWYLDCGFGTFIDPDPTNADSPIKYPYHDWCAPYKNWRQVLSYDPLAGIPQEHKHLVIGGEVHLWGELTDSANVDNMLWPRTAAAAEVLWRGKAEVGEETTRRLAKMRERLVARGIRSGMVQMQWGLENKGGCIL